MITSKKSIKISCENILNSVRSSNLNFSSSETPFSIYITIRKSHTKLPNSYEDIGGPIDNISESEIKLVKTENAKLKDKLEASERDIEDSYDLINSFKAQKDESQATLKKHALADKEHKEIIKKKEDEILILKGVLKGRHFENDALNGKVRKTKDILKSKEKDVIILKM